MQRRALLLVPLPLLCLADLGAAPCAPSDDRAQCSALVGVGVALRFSGWHQNTNWMSTKSYCSWAGVACNPAGDVTNLTLTENGLTGYVPPAIGGLR